MSRYYGKSLLWVRSVLGHKYPKIYNVMGLIEANKDIIKRDKPKIGQVVLFNDKPYGNIGLCVSDDPICLMFLGDKGIPTIEKLESMEAYFEYHYVGCLYWGELQ